MAKQGTPGGDIEEGALIVGGGPGISASCARRFADDGMRVTVAARNIDKPVLRQLADERGVQLLSCNAADPADVARMYDHLEATDGSPRLVVHNIDGRIEGIFRKSIVDAEPELMQQTLQNGAFSAFYVAQEAARRMLEAPLPDSGHRGSIIFTNASAALKGFAKSGAFAMTCHAKSGLAQSMARELMPQGIHVAQVPIDAAIGWTRDDGKRAHWLAGESVEDNMADPDCIAEMYLQLHRQHRSTWAFEVTLRPWTENW